MYINFKAINNVLDAKMVLKTHLFIKNILFSLQRFCQYMYVLCILPVLSRFLKKTKYNERKH